MSRHQMRWNLEEMAWIVQKKYIYKKRKTKNIIGQLFHGEGKVLANDA